MREWLSGLPKARHRNPVAAFDTRLASPITGSAARSIVRRLRRRGYDIVAKPAGFIVKDAAGPLRDGELERARAWGVAPSRQIAHLAPR